MSPPSTPALSSPPAVTWADPAREPAFQRWLHGIAGAHQLRPGTLRPASADASFRRYPRVDTDAGSRIIEGSFDTVPGETIIRQEVVVPAEILSGGTTPSDLRLAARH